MSAQLPLRVTELLTSRLCHDLVSPVGAINNGLELLSEEIGTQDSDFVRDAMGLAIDSGQKAAALLRFFRIAYGAAGAVAEVAASELRTLAEAYLVQHKSRLEWVDPPTSAGPPPGATVVAMRPGLADGGYQGVPPGLRAKLVLNAVSIAAQLLPRGGLVRLSFGSEVGASAITVDAVGEGARVSDELIQALAAGAEYARTPDSFSPDHLDARTITGFFTAWLAAQAGLRIELDTADSGRVRIQARK